MQSQAHDDWPGDRQPGHHDHDDLDWAAEADALATWDDLEEPRNRAIVDWLGVTPGQVVVEVGSGTGGMAAVLAEAVGPTGAVIAVDGSDQLLAAARERVSRHGDELVTIRADLEQPATLEDALTDRPVDLVYGSAVVHHLDDELAAIARLAGLLRTGGRLALAEGGLSTRFLPVDCGIGEPGLESRLAVAQEAWFWREIRPAGATVRTGSGWGEQLTAAGLTDVTTKAFLLDVPPPLDVTQRAVVKHSLGAAEQRFEEDLDGSDRTTLARLLDDDDPLGVMRRPDVFVLGVRTVHVGTRAAALP